MATLTLTHLSRLSRDLDGTNIPLADGYVGGETLTAAGTSAAAPDGARIVRIATDTAFTSNIYGAGTSTLHLAGTSEHFPIDPEQTITFTPVA